MELQKTPGGKMNRLIMHLIGLALIPLILAISVLAAGLALVLGVFVSLALLVVPGQVKFNGEKLSSILRKVKRA